MAASRSRRGPSKRQLEQDAEFASLRKILNTDELRSEQYQLDAENDVYEVVDEARYHEIVKERRTGPVNAGSDFVCQKGWLTCLPTPNRVCGIFEHRKLDKCVCIRNLSWTMMDWATMMMVKSICLMSLTKRS